MVVGKQAGEAGNWIDRYEDAPLTLFDGAGRWAYRFFMRWGEGVLFPRPRCFFYRAS